MKVWAFSNLHISACATLLTWGSGLVYGLDIDWTYLLLVFGSTLFLYNAQRLIKRRRFEVLTEQMEWVASHPRQIQALSLFGLLLCLPSYGLWLDMLSIAWPYLLLTLVYSVQMIPSTRGAIALRELPVIKIFTIAIVWTVVSLYLPARLFGDSMIPWTALVERGLFILAITVPFDVRDLPYDHPSMKTIPQLIGATASKNLSLALLAVCVALCFNSSAMGVPWAKVIGIIAIYAISAFLTQKAKPGGDYRLYNLGLDGMMGGYGILLLLIEWQHGVSF